MTDRRGVGYEDISRGEGVQGGTRARSRTARALLGVAMAVATVATGSVPSASQTAQPVLVEPDPTAARPDPQGLSFEPNVGQTDAEVQYLARGNGYDVFLSPGRATLTLDPAESFTASAPIDPISDLAAETEPIDSSVLSMEVVGADPEATVRGADPLPGTVNYYQGNDPGSWQTGVPTYRLVSYDEVYPGVGLDYYGNQGNLEYDFVVEPGADPGTIALRFDGADRVVVDDQGDLVLHTAAGEVRQPAPFIYQDDGGDRRQVAGGYALVGNEVRFEVEAYDPGLPLVIDPIMTYGTYLGGAGGDEGQAIAVDGDGNMIVAGDTDSTDFPGTAAGSYRGGVRDGFVAKISADGSELLWATYLGGTGEERARSVAVDDAGNVYAAGATFSAGAPGPGGTGYPTTAGAYREVNDGNSGSQDAYVTKLSPSGGMLYSTLLGGSRNDGRTNVDVDGAGDIYVSGFTFSKDFPTPNGYQPTLGDRADAFLVKLSPGGNGAADLLYGSYLGGQDNDTSRGIAVDDTGKVFIAGWTFSTDFPSTPGAFQEDQAGGGDTFVAKFDPTLAGEASLLYSTYAGGPEEQDFPYLGNCLAIDAAGNAHVTGYTLSDDYPTTPNAVQPDDPDPREASNLPEVGRDAFAFKLDADGSDMIYATYLGGTEEDEGIAAAVGPSGDGYFVGFTNGAGFPEADPLPGAPTVGRNAFVTRLDPNGGMVYSTQLGSDSEKDTAYGVAVNGDAGGTEVAHVMGFTSSSDFPTPGPTLDGYGYDGSQLSGDKDVFVAKIASGATTPRLSIAGTTVTESDDDTVVATFEVTRSGDTTGAVDVDYATTDGTAVAPGDYATTQGTLSFGPGETTKTIEVAVVGDDDEEPTETFTVTLSNPTGGATISTASATGTIVDDDDPPSTEPTLSIADTSVGEGDTGTVDATFTVTRSGDTTGSATVRYRTMEQSAISPQDYASRTGTLTFAPGDTSQPISVPVNGDIQPEEDETFLVFLGKPSGAEISQDTATGTILDDD